MGEVIQMHHPIIVPPKKVKLKDLKEKCAGFDMVSSNRWGHIVFRKAFFYRNGNNAEKIAAVLEENLKALGLQYEIIEKGEHWYPFKGGAHISKQSHWFVEVKFI